MNDAETNDAETVASTATAIGEWVQRLLPDADRARRLAEAMRLDLGQDSERISRDGCRRIEQVCHRYARHLTLEFDEAGSYSPDQDEPTGWPPPDGPALIRRGAGVRSVTRCGEIAVVRVDSLEPFEFAKPFVESAFRLAAGCRGLVLDLRDNGGGEMETLAVLAGLVLSGEEERLATVTSNTRVEEWTAPAAGLDAERGRPAVVLTSPRTYSSGEALAYVLKNRGIPVVGQQTPGAADHVVPVRVSRHVEALIPYAVVSDPITGGNWEGTGVIPTIETAADEQLHRATAMLQASTGNGAPW